MGYGDSFSTGGELRSTAPVAEGPVESADGSANVSQPESSSDIPESG